MRARLIFPALLIIAACEVPDSVSRTSAGGGTEIKLQNGQNCWDNQCMRYNAQSGSFSLPSRYSVDAPAGAVQAGGYMSVPAFQQTYERAIRTAFNGKENR